MWHGGAICGLGWRGWYPGWVRDRAPYSNEYLDSSFLQTANNVMLNVFGIFTGVQTMK